MKKRSQEMEREGKAIHPGDLFKSLYLATSEER